MIEIAGIMAIFTTPIYLLLFRIQGRLTKLEKNNRKVK